MTTLNHTSMVELLSLTSFLIVVTLEAKKNYETDVSHYIQFYMHVILKCSLIIHLHHYYILSGFR